MILKLLNERRSWLSENCFIQLTNCSCKETRQLVHVCMRYQYNYHHVHMYIMITRWLNFSIKIFCLITNIWLLFPYRSYNNTLRSKYLYFLSVPCTIQYQNYHICTYVSFANAPSDMSLFC